MARSDNRKKYDTKDNRVKIPINEDMIDRMIAYVLSTNSLVTLRSLTKMKDLLDNIDFNTENYQASLTYSILIKLLHFLVDENISDFNILCDAVIREQEFTDDQEFPKNMIDYCSNIMMSDEDIVYIDKWIEDTGTYIYFYQNRDAIKTGFDSLDSGANPKEVNHLLEPVINKLYKSIQDTKATQKEAAGDFCIGESNFKQAFKNAHAQARRPNNHIKTGLQGLNTMINGGYENGRTYLYLALPKCGKSMLLLNSGMWACKYNDFEPKDPTKIPTVLYLTMENQVRETMERIYAYATGEDLSELSEDKADEAISNVLTELIGEKNVRFEIKYRKHKSLSTLDMDRMISDLAAEGKEVVLLIQDYIKRIRSTMNYPDIRLELGEIVNEFCTIAKDRDIPIISASQLNRDAYRIIEMEQEKGTSRANITKLLNRSHVGESALLIENTDYAIIINPETDTLADICYTVFKLVASRSKKNKLTYFAQKMINGMRLEEDVDLEKPTYIENIGESTLKNFNPNEGRNTINKSSNNISNFKREITIGVGEINI